MCIIGPCSVMRFQDKEIWLPTLLARLGTFLFVFALLVLSLFLLGNFQSFLNSTLVMLLDLFEVTSMLFVVTALFYCLTTATFAIRRRLPWRLGSMVVSLGAAGALLGLHWIFNFLLVWLNPVN